MGDIPSSLLPDSQDWLWHSIYNFNCWFQSSSDRRCNGWLCWYENDHHGPRKRGIMRLWNLCPQIFGADCRPQVFFHHYRRLIELRMITDLFIHRQTYLERRVSPGQPTLPGSDHTRVTSSLASGLTPRTGLDFWMENQLYTRMVEILDEGIGMILDECFP